MTLQANTLAPQEANTSVEKSGRKSSTPRVLENFIGGRWTPSQASSHLDVTNPANGEVLARVPLSVAADVEAAVAAAENALPDWRGRSVGERAEFIFALRERFRQHIDELAQSVTREGGKVLSDARAEITRSIEVARGRLRDSDDDARANSRRCVTRHQYRDDPAARGSLRGDHSIQLSSHGADVVLAVRDRLRQHFYSQALGTSSAYIGTRLSYSAGHWPSRRSG